MHMTGIVAVDNGQEGLFIKEIGVPIEISDSQLETNSHGIRLMQCISNSTVMSVICQANREAGILWDNSDGILTVTALTVTGTNKYGLSYIKTDICKPTVNTRHLTISSSEFSGSQESGVDINENCGSLFVIDNTNFHSNSRGIRASNNNHVEIKKCTFINQTEISVVVNTGGNARIYNSNFHLNNRGVDVSNGGNNNNIAIEKCKFINHTETSVIINPGGSATIRNNEFKNNHLTCLDIKERGISVHIDRNVFTGTAVENSLPLYVLHLTTISAVVILRTKATVTLRYNQFNNPDVQFQLATTVRDIVYSIDAQYNYWGSSDINDVTKSLYGYHQQGVLGQIRYYPYILAKGTNKETSRQYPDVVQGHDIGGVVTDKIELYDNRTSYHVTKDIIVHATGTLLVGEGVTLEFEPGRGIIVMGTLQVQGSSSNEVIMTARRQSRHPRVRLLNEGLTVSGVIQIYSHAAWRSVCYNSFSKDRSTLDFLCRAAGFEGHVRYSYVQNNSLSFDSLPTFRCRSGRFSECVLPADGFTNCSADYVLEVTCRRNFWTGIHLQVDAHPSIIRHARLYHVNHRPRYALSNAAIHVDFLQNHVINNVYITDMLDHQSSRALFVSRVGVDSNRVDSLTAVMRGGTAVESHDSRIHLHDLNITCIRQHAGNGVYVESKIATIAGLKNELIVPFTSITRADISYAKSLFLNVNDGSLPYSSSHYVHITTSEGERIAAEVVGGRFPSCAAEKVMFHDGVRNESAAVGEPAGPDGALFRSTGSTIEILVRRNSYGSCVDTVLHVYAYKGKS